MKHVITALLTIIGITSIAEVILDYLAYRSDGNNKPTEHEAMCPYFVEPQKVEPNKFNPDEVTIVNSSEENKQ
jgi:hypothetical protein